MACSILLNYLIHFLDSGAAENISLTLQRKNISLQDALSAVETAKSFYKRMQLDKEFSQFYQKSVSIAKTLDNGEPMLQTQRRQPPYKLYNHMTRE